MTADSFSREVPREHITSTELLAHVNAQRVVDQLHGQISEHRSEIRSLCPGASAALIETLNIHTGGWQVGPVADGAAFRLEPASCCIVLSEEALTMIADGIIHEMQNESFAEKVTAMATMIRLYAIHETLHIPQGLRVLKQVRDLKELASPKMVGQFDLEADLDAAKVHAALLTAQTGATGRREYLYQLGNVLILCGSIAPKVFGAPADKAHKRSRFLGLLITARLIHDNLECVPNFEALHAPLDMPIYPDLDPETGRILLRLLNPRQKMIGLSTISPSDLSKLLDGLDNTPIVQTMMGVQKIVEAIEWNSFTVNLAAPHFRSGRESAC